MRLVLDTNVALSGLLWGGTPGRLIDAAEAGRVELVSSTALLAELQGVLAREKFVKQFTQRKLTLNMGLSLHDTRLVANYTHKS